MTLLATVASYDYALSCSDMRITVQSNSKFIPVDEHFNKHIAFHSGGLTANVTYTGLARWSHLGKTVKIYDIISESLSRSAKLSLAFGPLAAQLALDVIEALEIPRKQSKLSSSIIELHIIGYHEGIPWPFIGVISTFRTTAPWTGNTAYEWEHHFEGIHFYFKVAEKPEVIFGGVDSSIRNAEKQRLRAAVDSGADAFNVSRLASKLIEAVSARTSAVGPRSVAVVLPKVGLMDTNLWDKTSSGIVGFVPRMIFSNGTTFGPSEFPVNLNLLLDGQLPKQSLFFKSIISSEYKRRYKRLVFRHKKGLAIPGLLGLVMLALFGSVPEGYTDFGLSH